MFAAKHYTTTYLMDNDGRIVNSWESDYEPGQSAYLLESGHLLRCCFTKNRNFIGGGEGGGIEEYDWDGNLVWEFWYTSDRYLMHHDIEPLPNGNILALVVEKKTYEECLAAGFDPDALRDRQLFPDHVIEIEKTGAKSGGIVWEWHVWDHLIQDYDSSKANYGDVADHPELIDVHGSGRTIPAFWNHMNSIDFNRDLDQIILSVRGNSEFWIIDHSTTTEEAASHAGGESGKGGDLLYRWGNPQTYRAGDARDQKLFEQHDAQWIEQGCPGEGNILVFNNGPRTLRGADDRRGRGREREGEYSSVDEIVPPVDENGNYSLTPRNAYEPRDPAWVYMTENPADLYSEAISGAQRLPNGNTLVCDGVNGVFSEVTPRGEAVWEYVSPVAGDGPLNQGDGIPVDHRGHAMNAVFKIHRYAPDYPGLKGKDLTPKGTLVGESAGKDDRRSEADRPRQVGDERTGQAGNEQGQRRGGGRLMRVLDTNEDNELSTTEINNAAAAMKTLDRNGDGKLTTEELGGLGQRPTRPDQQRQGQGRGRGGRLMRLLDTDEDGELSTDEIENTQAALRTLDSDGDGKLASEELRRPDDRTAGPGQPRQRTERDLGQGDSRSGGRRQRDDQRPATQSVVAQEAKLMKLAGDFQFTEGPAADSGGNVFFVDIPANRIHRWSVDGQLSTFREDLGGANGLFFDKVGNLLACEGDNGRLVSIDPQGNVTVLADKYNDEQFNKPNDLWTDPKGGVYFSDPAYGRVSVVQDGEHVYYLTPDHSNIIRVINDMVRPNGIVGTPSGKVLYVTDHGAKKTYKYDVNEDGTLSNKTLFASIGSDGMTTDESGNVYLAEDGVLVYDSAGNQIESIDVPERPTNLCFGGRDRQTLFITARTSLYSIRMRVRGVSHFPHFADIGHNGMPEGMVHIPGGEFEMGDHHDLGGQEHRNDEVPVHTVYLDSFSIGKYEVTNQQYCSYLNSALSLRLIEVRNGLVYAVGGSDVYCETHEAVPYSRIGWDGSTFTILDNRGDHPMVCVRWYGALAYCNWLSSQNGHQSFYDLSTGDRDFAGKGFRLPTEAEWEYAGRGGQYDPYCIYPWGDDADYLKANWPNSGDPYETGPYPWTTPVGFYNGQLHNRADFDWPSRQDSYQTSDGSNGYGLYDMAGNVWEWVDDWYNRDDYNSSPKDNPRGSDKGTPMRDGEAYHVLRGGNWYNGPEGHSRVSNRNPAYYRGPNDPDHEWYHVGFRVVQNSQGGNRQ